MSSTRTDEIPWAGIGPSLERLLRYEDQLHSGGNAGDALLAALAGEPPESAWRLFLMSARNFDAVVDHVLDMSRRNAATPGAAAGQARTIAEAALGLGAGHDVLRRYLLGRALLPSKVRDRADESLASGGVDAPLGAVAFAAGIDRLIRQGGLDEYSQDVVEYWYREILNGDVGVDDAAALPDQLMDAKTRLLAYHAGLRFARPVDGTAVYSLYAFVLTAPDVPAAVDAVFDVYAIGLKLDPEQVEPFFASLPRDELVHRFRMLKDWIGDRYIFGKLLTPKLAGFLAQPGDFQPLLNKLERLSDETLAGRFRIDNILQRDLELQRFVMEYTKHNAVNRSLPYINESDGEMLEKFEKMKELPPQQDEPVSLTDEHLAQAKRSAYEAHGLLVFLRELRARTDRHIVVVGNDRYGRQWAVEPLEDFLKDGFTLRYDRAPSHMATALTVGSARFGEGALDIRGAWTPDIFPREFARQIGDHMPHVVIVDAMSPGKGRGDDLMLFSRANQGYANWFVAFNDVRAEGDGARYQEDTFLPQHHFPQVLKWHELVTLRRQLREWVAPGSTYRMSLWSPQPAGQARFGESVVTNVAPDLDTDRPQVVFANPVIYRDGAQDFPADLHSTRPYYFDGPESLVREKIIFGFGSHGFETRVVGPTTAMFVAAVQRAITDEVARLLEGD
jgi:hypothetical protein